MALVSSWLTVSMAFEDAFEDGNGDRWTLFDPIALLGLADPSTFDFGNGVFRLDGNPPAADPAGPARLFAYIDEEIYSDFYCTVDVVDWNDDINQAFGILGRVDNVGPGSTTGYVCNYDPNQTGGQPGGQFQINRVIDEASNPTIATGNVKLIADHSYRMVFRGEGDRLIGALYDLQDLTTPVVQIETSGAENPDAVTYTEGRVGLFCFYRGDDLTEAHARPDVTFDNFIVQESNPVPEWLPGIARGVASEPQVIAHEPATGATFHPAAAGLRFTVIPGEGGEEVSPELYLNGEQIPHEQIEITMEEDAVMGFYGGLEPNALYEARVSLGDVHSVWHFDTIEVGMLDSGEAIVIEAEDYNFGAGQFLDQPAAGGPTESGGILPNADESYYDRVGTLGVDYHDLEGGPVAENDYRLEDLVGLRSGAQEIEPGPLQRDVPRARHLLTGAQDYEIFQTEAGEWLNYTRTIPPGDYRVYVRAASQASQDILLDEVTSDRTQPNQSTAALGRFALANQVSRFDWRFTPLTDAEGHPTTLSLAGETTLRLTMGGDEADFAFRRVLGLNYLLLLPESMDDPNLVVPRGGLFGNLTGAETASLTLRNGGVAEPLSIASATVEGEDAAHFTVTDPPAILLPDETATIDVGFDPNGREGVFVAELVLTTNDESQPEIRVALEATIPVSSGLLVHYPFDDPAGSTSATDASGNRRHGNYVSEAGGVLTLGVEGLAGGSALRVNNGSDGGGGAHVEVPIAARLPELASMTALLWFRQDAGSGNVTILSKGLEAADPFAIAVAQETLAWGAAGEPSFQYENAYTVDTTHHLTVRYDAGAIRFTIDGEPLGDAMDGPVYDDGPPSPLLVGALTGGVLGFNGTLDDFQLYERVLTDDEIGFLYNNPGQALAPVTSEPGGDAATTTSVSRVADGSYRLTVDGPAGRQYTVESSPSLRADSWTEEGTFEAGDAPLEIMLQNQSATVRFYRLRY